MLDDEISAVRAQLTESQSVQIRQHSNLNKAHENEKDALARSERLLLGEKFKAKHQEKELLAEQHNFKMYKEQVAEYHEQLKKEIREKAKMIEDLERKHSAEKRALRLELRLVQRDLENESRADENNTGQFPRSPTRSTAGVVLANHPRKTAQQQDADFQNDNRGEEPEGALDSGRGRRPSKTRPAQAPFKKSKSRSISKHAPQHQDDDRSSSSLSSSPASKLRRSNKVFEQGPQHQGDRLPPAAAGKPSRSSSKVQLAVNNDSSRERSEPSSARRPTDLRPPVQPLYQAQDNERQATNTIDQY